MEEISIRTCETCRGSSSEGSSSGVDLRPNDEVLCTVCWIDSLSGWQDNTSNQFLAGSEDQLKTVNTGEAEPENANSEPTISNYENQVEVSSSVFNNKDKKDFGTNDISSNDSFDFNTSTSTDLSNHSGQESKNSSVVGLSQGSSPAGLGDNTNTMLFDNLIQHFSFVNKSGKELCKFKGNLSELSDFAKLVLEIEGEYHTAKDPNQNVFRSSCKEITLNYWLSTQTFSVNGKKEKKIKKKIKQLVTAYHKKELPNKMQLDSSPPDDKATPSTVQPKYFMHSIPSTTPGYERKFNTLITTMHYADGFETRVTSEAQTINAFDNRFKNKFDLVGEEMDRIWSSIQNLTSWFEENVRLLELLQAEKDEKVFLHRTIEEKDYLINNLNEQLRKLELQRISPTGDNRQADWEKPKKAVKNVFPPMWEMPTTNRFNDLDFEDNDILEDNNAPDDSFEIQLSNVKLKRKILYLQTKVRSSEPSVEHYSDNQDYQHAEANLELII